MPFSSRPLSAIVAALLSCATFGPGAPCAGAATQRLHGDAPGIEWFAGDVAAAFDAARTANRPVFLYWGAKWCPPCQQLKSSVFSRNDFIEKSHQFVPVYLDGDDPGAQRWGERFHVSGYPTVVILRADQREITRISGGLDLSLYADLLDIALSDARPLSEVLAAMRDDGVGLSHADCQRLAYYAWDLADSGAAERESLARGLDRAAATCSNATALERARLHVAAAAMQPTAERAGQVVRIVADRSVAAGVADALGLLDDPFFAAVRDLGPATSAGFVAAWTRTMDDVAADPAVIAADQLSAIAAKLRVLKTFSTDGSVPRDAAAEARVRLGATLGRSYDPYVRAGIVDAASAIDESLGDDDAEYAMLRTELATSKTPFYYMVDLGEAEEKRGHAVQALAWFERAYAGSSGVATRFQWGSLYLSALLRLAPDDHVRIRKVGLQVIAELDGPDRIQARTRTTLAKLEQRLRAWNAQGRHAADIRALQARMSGVCAKQPPGESGSAGCRHFLT